MKTVKQYVRSTETGEIRVITNNLKSSKYWRNFTPKHVSITEKYKKKPFSGTRAHGIVSKEEIAYELARGNTDVFKASAEPYLKYYMKQVTKDGTFDKIYCNKTQMMTYQQIMDYDLKHADFSDKKTIKAFNKYTEYLTNEILENY